MYSFQIRRPRAYHLQASYVWSLILGECDELYGRMCKGANNIPVEIIIED